MDWSPSQYLKFEDERTRPARDLMNAVPNRRVRKAIDLGCGPGNSTELIVERYPDAEVSGIDSSADMVAKARERVPGIAFEVADIGAWGGEGAYDLILANAVLQWLPDHEQLLPHLVHRLGEGGSLAIQMPDNLDEPSHRSMRDAARQGPWASRLAAADATRTEIGSPQFYYDLLQPLCRRVEIWRTIYHHPLDGVEGVIQWFKATGLMPYLALLDEGERQAYLDRYRDLLRERYHISRDGCLLLAFPRLFIVATSC